MKKGCLFSAIGFFVFAVLLVIVFGTGDETEAIKPENVLIDVTQFSKITPEQLIKIMGEPESKETWNYESSNGNVYPTTTYAYKNGDYEFLIIDDKVVEINITASEKNIMKYTDKSSVFSMFGIKPEDTMVEFADTGVALRYESVTSGIEEFWIPIMDSDKKTLDTIKVRYDKSYFGALPRIAMSTSEESDLQMRCERGVKEFLKSPSSAKFPSINGWYFGKDREKIVAQSYVDAQNSFGAMLRSEFQVTFTPDGESVTSFIFDGKEYVKK